MVNPLARGGRVLMRAARRFRADEAMTRAAALTFTTLLSLVPFLAVFFAILSGFGTFFQTEARLEAFLLRHLLPSSAAAAIQYLTRFTQQTGTVGLIGFVALLAIALFLLNGVETAFRRIYRLPEGRSVRQRLLSYWTMLTVAPLLLGLSIYVSAAARRLAPLAESAGLPGGGVLYLSSVVAPLLIAWGAFALAYLVLPATPVRLRAAAAGGLVAAVLWEAGKTAFDLYIRHLALFEQLYGAVAVVPIFLVWVDLTWVIVLFGAEVAYCAQHPEPGPADVRPDRPHPTPGPLAARVFWVVAREFAASRGRPTVEAVADELKAEPEAVSAAVTRLEEAGLVARVFDPADADDPRRLLPARPLAEVTVAEVVRAGEAAGRRFAEWAEAGSPVLGLLAAAEAEAATLLEGATYGTLVERWRARQEPEGPEEASRELASARIEMPDAAQTGTGGVERHV